MINLTRGVPPVEVFQDKKLIKASEKSLREDGKRVLQYLQVPGYPPLSVTLPVDNLMEKLLPAAAETGIKLTDGRGFYLNPKDGDRFLRIPFCSLTPEEIKSAVRNLSKIIIH